MCVFVCVSVYMRVRLYMCFCDTCAIKYVDFCCLLIRLNASLTSVLFALFNSRQGVDHLNDVI